MQKWEYKSVAGKVKWNSIGLFDPLLYYGTDATDKVISLGQEGWELVSVVIMSTENSPTQTIKSLVWKMQYVLSHKLEKEETVPEYLLHYLTILNDKNNTVLNQRRNGKFY